MKPYYETPLGKLYHGDCRDYIGNLHSDFVYTDPPYNAKKHYGPYKDNQPDKEYLKFMEAIYSVFTPPRYMKLITHIPKKYMVQFLNMLGRGTMIVIARGAHGYLNGYQFTDQCDFLYAIGKPIKACPTLWTGIRLKGEGYFFREETYGHFGYTPEPIAMMAISKMTEPGQIVLDPFGGTGTTGNACERLSRKWILIEYEEKYCEIAAKRIENGRKQLKLF